MTFNPSEARYIHTINSARKKQLVTNIKIQSHDTWQLYANHDKGISINQFKANQKNSMVRCWKDRPQWSDSPGSDPQ